MSPSPSRFGGHDASIVIDRENDPAKVIPQTSTGRIKETVTLKGEGAESERNHFANLFDAIRADAPLNCPVDLGYKVNGATAMGVMAYRQQTGHRLAPQDREARAVRRLRRGRGVIRNLMREHRVGRASGEDHQSSLRGH